MYEEMKQRVYQANKSLKDYDLIIFSWGNVSEIDRENNIIAIKPSGVPYDELTPEKIVLVDLDGNIVEGELKPSSDTETHLELYKNFEEIGGICHTHSTHATMWAQACQEIPCLGTTHADHFYGNIPVTERMEKNDIEQNYEKQTGKYIVREFQDKKPMYMPAVLVANHGPFVWGNSAHKAVKNSVVLEELAKMAQGALNINSGIGEISQELLDKHFLRKHGEEAYYGQN